MDRGSGARTASQASSVPALMAGLALCAAAIWLSARGGLSAAASAGIAAACGLALLTPGARNGAAQARAGLFDAFVVAAYAALVEPSGVLWRAPDAWGQLFAFTPVGAGFASLLYIGALLIIMTYTARRPIRRRWLQLHVDLRDAGRARRVVGRYRSQRRPVDEASAPH